MFNINTYDLYNIPQTFYTKFKLSRLVLYLILSLGFFLVTLFISFILASDYDIEGLLLLLFSLMSFVYFLGDFFQGSILKKQYIEITNEHIKVKNFLTTKTIKWDKINSVIAIPDKFNPMIGIVKEGDFWLKTPSIIQRVARGSGYFYITIYLSKFNNIDMQKLFNTLSKRITQNY